MARMKQETSNHRLLRTCGAGVAQIDALAGSIPCRFLR
jgi:hypothetical protein